VLIGGKKKEPVSDGINHAVGDLNAAAFLGNVIPKCRPARPPPPVQGDAPLPARGLLCCESIPSTPLHFSGQFAHGLLRDEAPFTSSQGGFRLIDCNENFRSGAFTFFPQGKGFQDRIFFPVKPSTLNRLADKRLLIGGELYFHHLQGTEKRRFGQVADLRSVL
jgi:hypothetical protein